MHTRLTWECRIRTDLAETATRTERASLRIRTSTVTRTEEGSDGADQERRSFPVGAVGTETPAPDRQRAADRGAGALVRAGIAGRAAIARRRAAAGILARIFGGGRLPRSRILQACVAIAPMRRPRRIRG